MGAAGTSSTAAGTTGLLTCCVIPFKLGIFTVFFKSCFGAVAMASNVDRSMVGSAWATGFLGSVEISAAMLLLFFLTLHLILLGWYLVYY